MNREVSVPAHNVPHWHVIQPHASSKSQAARTSSLEDTCLVPLGFDYNIYRPAYDKLSAMLSGSLGFVMAAWQFITL